MSNSLVTQLYTATALTFEELGFILPSSELQDSQKAAALEAAVGVSFTGPMEGRLVLAVYGGILPTVVANMLGDEEAFQVNSQHDALGELANVICGNVLPGIAGDRATFILGTPQLVPAKSLVQTEELPTIEVNVGLDEGRAVVYLYVKGGLASLPGELAA
jgi:CheY-specific phosphatase CheX